MTSFFFLATIVAGTVGPICIKLLIQAGMPYTDLIFWRSLFAILFVMPFAFQRGTIEAIFCKTSLTRMFIGGAVLSLSVLAYASLSATEVNLIGRLDLPIFVLLFAAGSKKWVAGMIVILGAVYSYTAITRGLGQPMLAVWTATALTAVSYKLIRNIATKRNLCALVVPPYFGALIVVLAMNKGIISAMPVKLIPIVALTSLCAVGLYIFTAELFRRMRLGGAELTGSIALLCTFAAESLFLGIPGTPQIGVVTVMSILFGTILIFWEEIQKCLRTKLTKDLM